MLKVLKFGGSSMADAHQFAKVKAIVDSDPSRRVVVVSAAGKRSRDDHKLTDLLYLCYAHLQYGVSCDAVFDMIRSRYLSIRDELHLSTPLEAEFAALREKMDRGISQDELVSRGEYFAARLMADYLGYDFLDSICWLRFRLDGTVDQPASYEALRRTASGRRVVIPGFYGAMPDGSVKTFTRGGSDITGALGGGGAGRRRLRELDRRLRLPHGRPQDRAGPPPHRAHHLRRAAGAQLYRGAGAPRGDRLPGA